MRHCLMLALSVLTISGCANSTGGRALMEEASRAEFGSASYLCADTVAVAKAAGYDYEKLVSRCSARDRQALHDLFSLTRDAGWDAAAAQGNATVLGLILRSLGDESFAECLASEPPEVRREVGRNLEYALGESRELRVEFPRTYAACFTVAERVQHLVYSCLREVHGWWPDSAVASIGIEAVPALLSMMDDPRTVWVRIGPPQGGPESRFVDVEYLLADDEGPRSSVAEFALLCICVIREPRSGSIEDFTRIWDPVMHEFTDYDGKVSDETIDEIRKWYDAVLADGGQMLVP